MRNRSDRKTAGPPPPSWHHFAYMRAVQATVAGIDQQMQSDIRGARVGGQSLQFRLVHLIRDVEKIDPRQFGPKFTSRAFLHARDEGRDADACADPDLLIPPVIEGEAAV
ncbi:hypothetical protein [Paracoccus ravus]|uniref:hypothetical protein n=1 Tax=Paracoccus ravus TaxID=2447760 RepID=UPI00106EDD0C|nr:hypothetical protein [Paracoccus ravus]